MRFDYILEKRNIKTFYYYYLKNLLLLLFQETFERWRLIFWISFGVYMFGTVSYILLSAGEKQPWATPDGKELLGSSTPDPKETNAEEGKDVLY